MLFPRILFFGLCLKITTSRPLGQNKENLPRVFDPCDEDIGCRANAFCARRGCDGLICMCNIGYQPSSDSTECLKVVELYRSCADKNNTRCRGPLAYCDSISKTCHCKDGYIPARDNIRCKKAPKYNLSYAMLGEDCDIDVICQDANQQVCSLDTSKCTCREGLKPASTIDLNAEPFVFDECRPADFNLESELDECKKPDIIGIALIGQHCITDNNCPENSKCKRFGCEKKQCRCINGTVPTGNLEHCKPAAILHQPCNDSVVCFGAYTACVQGICKCSHGSIEAINNQCKSSPPIPGRTEFAALGEECSNGENGDVMKMCESAICIEGLCSCPPPMREMTFAEMLDNPNTFPTCIAIDGLTEITDAEYEIQCVTLLNELADFNDLEHTGVKTSVTASWDEEPHIVMEDNMEASEVEFNESRTIIDGELDANNSVNFEDLLMGGEGNSSLRADEIAERLFSLNESLSEELLNASMSLNSINASNSNTNPELAAINETVNFLLENDFDAADFNESFDAEYLPDELSFFNDSVDTSNWNGTQDILSVNGSLDAGTTNSSFNVNLNDSYDVDILNSSLSLDISNSSLVTESSNNSFHLDASNSSLSNSSFDEMTLNSSLDFESSNLSNDSYGVDILNNSLDSDISNISLDTESSNNSLHLDVSNSSLSNSTFDEMTLNSSLDLISSNSSEEISTSSFSENISNVYNNISDSSLRNETLNDSNETQALNMSVGDEVSGDDLQMANESLEMNGTDEDTHDLLEHFGSSTNESLEVFSENFNQSSWNESLDLNDMNHSNSSIDKNVSYTGNDSNVEINDLDQANESQITEVLNSSSTLLNTTENFDMETLVNASSINESLEVDTVNGSLEILSEDHDVMSSNETIIEESVNGTIGNEAEDLMNLNHNENESTGENITIGSNDILTTDSFKLTTNNPFISESTHADTNDFDDVLFETTTGSELGNTFDELSTYPSDTNVISGTPYSEESTSAVSTGDLSTESEMGNLGTEVTSNPAISNTAHVGTNDFDDMLFDTTTGSELSNTLDELSFYTSGTEGISGTPYSEDITPAGSTGNLATEDEIENLETYSTEVTANPAISSTTHVGTNDFDSELFETTTGSELGNTFTEQSLSTSGTKGISDIPYSEESTGNLPTEGGMEERLQEESPDLGLAISEDGTHFIGSSGDEFEPISYNDDADEDVNQVDELVAKGNYNNRNLLEKCDAMDSCPPFSQCLDIGCGSSICVCLDSYGVSEDRTTCIPGNFPPVDCSDLVTYEGIQPNEDD